MIEIGEIEEFLLPLVQNIHRIKETSPISINRNVIQEYIKGHLFCYAINRNFVPLPEFMPLDYTKHRIDIVFMKWCNNPKLICGIEIDANIAKKSIRKLKALPYECEKLIISCGSGNGLKTYYIPDDFYWIDLTTKRIKKK